MTRYSTTTDDAAAFVGSDTRKYISNSLSFQDVSAFTVTGARVKDGKLTVKAAAFGIVLYAPGGGAGDWRRINGDGDDLTQADMQ